MPSKRASRLRKPTAIAIPGQVAALRSLLAAYRIQLDVSINLAKEALAALPEDNVLMRGFALWVLSAYGALYRESVDVRLDQVARIGLDSGNVLVAVSALTQLGETERRRGHLRKAWNLYQRALNLAVDAQGKRLPLAGQPLLGLGDLAGEWHDLEAAEGYLQESITLSEQWSEVGALEPYLALAWVKWAQGDADGAQVAIDKARKLAVLFDATDVDDWAVALMQARYWLAQGNLDDVQRWLDARDVMGYAGTMLPEDQDDAAAHSLAQVRVGGVGAVAYRAGQP